MNPFLTRCFSDAQCLTGHFLGNRLIGFAIVVMTLSLLLPSQMVGLRAQEELENSGLELVSVLPFGVKKARSDSWIMLTAIVRNRSDKDQYVLLSSHYHDRNYDRYARRVWMPANSIRRVWYPIKFGDLKALSEAQPDNDNNRFNNGITSVDVTSFLLQRDGGAETAVQKVTKEISDTKPIVMDDESVITAVIQPAGTAQLESSIRSPYEAVIAMRAAGIQGRLIYELDLFKTGTLDLNLDPIDQIIVSDPDIVNHPDMMNLLRDWAHKGGHLWLMLDKIGIDATRQLIGAKFQGEWVDRTHLTDFQFISSIGRNEKMEHPLRSFEKPVAMDQLFLDGAEVLVSVNDWPALFRYNVGQGKVMVSAIESAAMLRYRTKNDSGPPEQYNDTKYYPVEPFMTMGAGFFQINNKPEIQEKFVFESHESEIGHSIPSRGFVALTLVGFCLAIGCAGVFFWKTENLHQMIWVTPVVAIGTSAVLMSAGYANKTKIPDSMFETRVVRVSKSGDEATVSGFQTIYTQNGTTKDIRSTGGGKINLQEEASAGTSRRFILNDTNQWEVENTTFRPGLFEVSYQQDAELKQPLVASASFDDDRINGQIELPENVTASDLILTTPRGHLIGQVEADGSFSVKVESTTGQNFIGTGFLNDSQVKHQEFYRMLAKEKQTKQIEPYTLMFWTNSQINERLSIGDGFEAKCDVLNIVPLTLESTPAKTKVELVSEVLGYKSVRGPAGESASTAYDRNKQEWIGVRQGSKIHLAVSLPDSLLPFQLEKVKVQLILESSDRTLEFFGFDEGKPVSIRKVGNANGTYEVEISDPKQLVVRPDGTFLIGVEIGKTDNEIRGKMTDLSTWKIDDIKINATGTTLEVKKNQ